MEEDEILDTKGDSIRVLLLKNVTNVNPFNDLISGDSKGNLLVFSNHEILSRTSIGTSITALDVDPNNNTIIAGDSTGSISAYRTPDVSSEKMWKFRLLDNPEFASQNSQRTGNVHKKKSKNNPKRKILCFCFSFKKKKKQSTSFDCSIRNILLTEMKDTSSNEIDCLLVNDGSKSLNFYVQNLRSTSLSLRFRVNSVRKNRTIFVMTIVSTLG